MCEYEVSSTGYTSEEILNRICRVIDRLLSESGRGITVGIDGRCCAGKSTLGNRLAKQYPEANLFSADDFFLPFAARTEDRLREAGGNFDRERFFGEIIDHLHDSKPFSYRPFRCSTGTFGEPVYVMPSRLNLIEGAYCLHPELRKFYDLKIFLDVTAQEQTRRLLQRNAERYPMFRDKWIPLEERYHATCRTRENCDLYFLSARFS